MVYQLSLDPLGEEAQSEFEWLERQLGMQVVRSQFLSFRFKISVTQNVTCCIPFLFDNP